MRYIFSVAVSVLFSVCIVACSEDSDMFDNIETADCDLGVYQSSKYDVIQKACNYIERCNPEIYTLYSNASYPKGLSDECHCNQTINEILDNNSQDSVVYQAYSDIVNQIPTDMLVGACSDNITGILKAKIKVFLNGSI